jgi:hypothetical protein
MNGNIKDILTGIFQPLNSKFREDEVREYGKYFDRHFLATENLNIGKNNTKNDSVKICLVFVIIHKNAKNWITTVCGILNFIFD